MSEKIVQRIFISYARADREFVKRLKDDLQNQGFATWIYWEDLELGISDWAETLREALRSSYAVLLIASPHARASRYVNDELRIADLYQRPVHPIWISGSRWEDAAPPDPDWKNKNYIDARDNKYARALIAIGAALRSPPPTHSTYVQLPEPRNPYKGLHAFKADDACDFFGRESFIDELTQALNETLAMPLSATRSARLLAIIGPSGSGKSSVLRAGLLSALRAGRLPNSNHWIYLDLLALGSHPLEDLANLLAPKLPDTQPEVILSELKKTDVQSLDDYATQLTDARDETYVVLILDQFEEIFAATTSEKERHQFIELLVSAVTEPAGRLIVLLTLRADFYDRPLSYPALASLIQHHQRLLLPPTLSDLRAAITRPALLDDVQVTFEEDLVGDILFDLKDQPRTLPLLQSTLDLLFRHRKGQLLTAEAYEAIGGVNKALAQYAENTYNCLPSDEHKKFARFLFLRLMEVESEKQEPVRRRTASHEFLLTNEKQTRVLQETIEAFSNAQLITIKRSSSLENDSGSKEKDDTEVHEPAPPESLDENARSQENHQQIEQEAETTFVEMSHEALAREWKRLSEWLGEAPEEKRLQQELSRDATDWQREKPTPDRLYRGRRLKAARTWAKRNLPSQDEDNFLQASQQRQTYARLHTLAIVVMVLLLAIPTTLFALPLLRASVTTLSDDGAGSLRQAIVAAKPGDTVTFDANLKGTIFLNDVLTVNKNLTIRGPGSNAIAIVGGLHAAPVPSNPQAILKFGASDYTIHVLPKFSVSISGLSFKDSKHTANGFILNEGNLTLSDCVVSNNSVTGSDATNAGIVNTGGTLKLINSTISGNTVNSTATVNAGAIAGAIRNDSNSTLILTNSTISNNTVIGKLAGGAGIANHGMLVITNSIVSNNTVIGDNVAIGGGIWNLKGTISLNNSTITGNKVICNDAPTCKSFYSKSGGGGLYNSEGKAQLTNSRVSNNQVTGGDGGGGIYNTLEATLTLSKSVVSDNSVSVVMDSEADEGGGIVNVGMSNATITDSLITSNQIGRNSGGGGIANRDNSTLQLSRSTVANNGAEFGGGIISSASSTLTLINSTISDNSAFSYGGGIVVISAGLTTITFCTIYGNTASLGTGGLIVSNDTTVQVRNSIIAGNNARYPDILGTVVTYGYNLLVESTDVEFTDPLNLHHTDLPAQTLTDLGIDARLQNNGGTTLTHALLPTSPAVNYIPLDACLIDNISTDQRGVQRPQGGLCDIGAYEYTPS